MNAPISGVQQNRLQLLREAIGECFELMGPFAEIAITASDEVVLNYAATSFRAVSRTALSILEDLPIATKAEAP